MDVPKFSRKAETKRWIITKKTQQEVGRISFLTASHNLNFHN